MCVYSDDFDIFCNFVGVHSFLPYESPASKLLMMMMMMMMSPFSCFCFDSELGNVMGERRMKSLTLTV